MRTRLLGQGADVKAAKDHAGPEETIAVGELISLANLGGKTGDGDNVEFIGDTVDVVDVWDFNIFEIDFTRSQPR